MEIVEYPATVQQPFTVNGVFLLFGIGFFVGLSFILFCFVGDFCLFCVVVVVFPCCEFSHGRSYYSNCLRCITTCSI